MLLYFVDDEYYENHKGMLAHDRFQNVNWLNLINFAKEEGLLFFFLSKTIQRAPQSQNFSITDMIDKEEREFNILKNTLSYITSFFQEEGIDYRFIKLDRGMPYVPRDVDILVKGKQIKKILSALGRWNLNIENINGVEIKLKREGLLNIDLYQNFYYLSKKYIDDSFLWENPRIINICDVKCPTLNYEADFLSLIIHGLLGHRSLSLLDFLYAKSIYQKRINFRKIEYQVRKNDWTFAYYTMVSTINDIYKKLYVDTEIYSIDFPYLFSLSYLFNAFQGFVNFPLTRKQKVGFIVSTLIDKSFYEYERLQTVYSIKLPDEIEIILQRIIYKVRSISKDKKFMPHDLAGNKLI